MESNYQSSQNQPSPREIEAYLNALPSGFKFDPTKEELIIDYLKPKIDGKKLPINLIHEVNIYMYTPDQLIGT